MKKKLLSVVLCGVMAAALLAGCGKKIGKDRAANNKNSAHLCSFPAYSRRKHLRCMFHILFEYLLRNKCEAVHIASVSDGASSLSWFFCLPPVSIIE